MPLKRHLDYIGKLAACDGPRPSQYGKLGRCLTALNRLRERGLLSPDDLRRAFQELGPPFNNPETLIGYTLAAERHGGYQIIDWLYQRHITPDKGLEAWDAFYHSLDAAEAVRNRKKFFVDYLLALADERPNARVLVVGSGPCRDVLEFFQRAGSKLQFHCVDFDAAAISYATRLCRDYLDHIRFFNQNVFRLKLKEKYDLIASLGLFDYLDDSLFRRMLRRLTRWLLPSGEILIGNFGPHSSRGVMQCSGWALIERTPAQLLRLGQDAGVSTQHIWVATEPLNIIQFLRVSACGH